MTKKLHCKYCGFECFTVELIMRHICEDIMEQTLVSQITDRK